MDKIIYIRTSTKEQTPELQLRDISTLINIDSCRIFKDKQSAWQDFKERIEFNELKKLIVKKSISDIYVWDLDRIYRNRKKLIEFFELCKIFKCKIHSYRQGWLEDINKIPEPWNDIIYSFMIQIMGWMAEEESNKKSERVKNAVTQKKNYKGILETTSKYGNKWGRKGITPQTQNKILFLHEQGESLREIQKQVFIFDQYGNKKKNISLGAVHKIVTENKVVKTS